MPQCAIRPHTCTTAICNEFRTNFRPLTYPLFQCVYLPFSCRKRKIILSGPEAQKKLREGTLFRRLQDLERALFRETVFVFNFVSPAIRLRQASGRGKDLFRARKQNTSRPPSMHVDDFMAMGARGVGHRQVGLLSLSLSHW